MKRILAFTLLLPLLSCSDVKNQTIKDPAPSLSPSPSPELTTPPSSEAGPRVGETPGGPSGLSSGSNSVPAPSSPPQGIKTDSASGSLLETTILPVDVNRSTVTGIGPEGENPRSCLLKTTKKWFELDCLGQRVIKVEQAQVPAGRPVPAIGLKTWAASNEDCPKAGTGLAQWVDLNANKIFDRGEPGYSVVNICTPEKPIDPGCSVTNPSADNVMISCPEGTEIIATGSTVTVCMLDRLPDRYTWTWSVEEFLLEILKEKDFTYRECAW